MMSLDSGVVSGQFCSMKVTYIHHSSFLIEDEARTLLFDYFEGNLPRIATDRPLYVFASHRHGDHFSPVIFNLAKEVPDIRYILSADIWKKRVPTELLERTAFLKPDSDISFDGLVVSTLKSTDEGVAFLVSSENWKVYHAGDLNNWYWAEESDDWNTKMAKSYLVQLKKLRDVNIDVAFVPVDPRLERAYSLGAEELMEATIPTYLFPMHFWGDFSVCEKLKALWQEKGFPANVMEITRSGQVFELPLRT